MQNGMMRDSRNKTHETVNELWEAAVQSFRMNINNHGPCIKEKKGQHFTLTQYILMNCVKKLILQLTCSTIIRI